MWKLFIVALCKLVTGKPGNFVPRAELLAPTSRARALWALLLFVAAMPLYWLAMAAGSLVVSLAALAMLLFGERARYDEHGLARYTLVGRRIKRHEWEEVAEAVIRRTMPMSIPTLILKDGTRVDIPLADSAMLESACLAVGVPFSREPWPFHAAGVTS